MFGEERQTKILHLLTERGKVTVEELSAEFGVSAPTVRADLTALEAKRLLRRTHGGALPVGNSHYEPPYSERAVSHADEKRRIGRLAAERICPGETIILDAGTTTHEIGVALVALGTADITVVTNALPTAMVLMEATGIDLIVIGGQAQARRQATLGVLASQFLLPIRADKVFLGVSGVDSKGGLTAADFDAASVKQTMIAQSNEVIVVADYSKIGQVAFAHVASLANAHLLLTDSELPDHLRAEFREAGLDTHFAL